MRIIRCNSCTVVIGYSYQDKHVPALYCEKCWTAKLREGSLNQHEYGDKGFVV